MGDVVIGRSIEDKCKKYFEKYSERLSKIEKKISDMKVNMKEEVMRELKGDHDQVSLIVGSEGKIGLEKTTGRKNGSKNSGKYGRDAR